MTNILICDDERDIVSALKIYLSSENYRIFEAYTGREALVVLDAHPIHLILLDIMMPDMDGIATLVKLRETHNIPVILLSAKSEDTDKIIGLNLGADDYITKPFNPAIVVARVRSHLRRYRKLGAEPAAAADDRLTIGPIDLYDREKLVTLEDKPVALTPIEYEILKLLMKDPGTVYSPRQVYEAVWQDNPYGAESTVAVHIRHIREKLEPDPAEPRYLKVVWGRGYKIEKE